MEGFAERTDLRRMRREEERERRRIRDRQRRQSMTQEQREKHLARRRRNYQLRRHRAAIAYGPFIPLLHQNQSIESSAAEASTSDELQEIISNTLLDYSVLCHGIGLPQHVPNQGLETLNLRTNVDEGSSRHVATLDRNPANSSTKLRLNHVRRLARNVTCSSSDPAGIHQVAAELITKEDVSTGDYGSTAKSLRLNCIKRLARSRNSAGKETIAKKNHNLQPEGIQLPVNESCIASISL
ncbi:PREDICTED: uncharacterized protein LOC109333815 [Lupinus angustifolius]|uniref:uncharacterized protein LOC109333815 n=1 Tax=Lupinus angustifolius TaxID=3871 RepID=UPI00092FB249|nr:PREDICTED: uncharacterized protein LOC109333815 [Lupinus angustifolius]XP_019424935.1 PREDICTED: uncharacterized protein LOC109333815 [Lupinus angustifolius]XP_019424936.1 PREDICTED: uncharacterized protein LOC109333815 [Lupinus angustifolius]